MEDKKDKHYWYYSCVMLTTNGPITGMGTIASESPYFPAAELTEITLKERHLSIGSFCITSAIEISITDFHKLRKLQNKQ